MPTCGLFEGLRRVFYGLECNFSGIMVLLFLNSLPPEQFSNQMSSALGCSISSSSFVTNSHDLFPSTYFLQLNTVRMYPRWEVGVGMLVVILI